MKLREILRFWLPLYASWLLMTAEGPMISVVVNRLPNEVIMVAAQGIVIGLSVLLESPIINILATSTAKVTDWASYRLVRRFTIHWMILLTVLHLAFAFTPLFDVVVLRAMGIPADIAEQVRIGMQIMIFWSAAIAWRRFLQGVLIKFDRTRDVTLGTVIRLTAGVATALVTGFVLDLPGVVVAGLTWMMGVLVEAAYATLAVRPLFDGPLRPSDAPTPLTYRALLDFHLPLASTALITLLIQPLAQFSLARLPQPTLTLAAWPILFQILLMARAHALASPEAIIALNRSPAAAISLRRFIGLLAGGSVIGMAVFVFTPLADWYIFTVQDTTDAVGGLVAGGLTIFLLFPGLTMVNFGLRGFLMSSGHTQPINIGMVINLATTAFFLFLGVALTWPGITTGAIAINVAIAVETAYLAWEGRRRRALELAASAA